ncbi:MAG: hypothetical protein Kow0088_22030 [Anaerolineales bacterium]
MAVERAAIWLIVGDSGSGKTTFCQGLIAACRERRLNVRGVICPARFEASKKVGIDVLDLTTGERHKLGWQKAFAAESRFSPAPIMIGEWLLDPQVIQWGNLVLQQSVPCDVLVIDELGPLEFIEGKGWQEALRVLESGAYRLGLVTVRESLRHAVHHRWRVEREIGLKNYPSLESALAEGREWLAQLWEQA